MYCPVNVYNGTCFYHPPRSELFYSSSSLGGGMNIPWWLFCNFNPDCTILKYSIQHLTLFLQRRPFGNDQPHLPAYPITSFSVTNFREKEILHTNCPIYRSCTTICNSVCLITRLETLKKHRHGLVLSVVRTASLQALQPRLLNC